MFKHYFTIGWRNLWKNKAFSLVNIMGLTAGITCCLLIVLYVQHELSYDKFQEKGNRIVRVIMAYNMGGFENKGNYTGTKVLPSFVSNFPEIETGVRMAKTSRVIHYNEKFFTEKRFFYTDSTFFRMFSYKLLEGNPNLALAGPNKVVLTKTSAEKYFGNESPLGKTLPVGSSPVDYEVTGVIEDFPATSQIRFDFLASFSSLQVLQDLTYWNANYTTYFLLKDASLLTSLQAKIGPFMKKEMSAEMQGNDYLTYELEPFSKVHLHSPYDGFEPGNNITYIYIVIGIALLILLIACFTYINLSTARSIERAREVGIRKVTGAVRGQIFRQFISESVILSLLALVLGLVAVRLCLPAFNNLTESDLSFSDLIVPSSLTIMVAIVIFVSLLAGSYPALMLSKFQPVKVLKGSFKNSGSGLFVRKSLLIFQFAITIFLITSTVIIQKQLHYIQNKNLGYNREQVVALPMDAKMNEKFDLIKTALLANPNIVSVAGTADNPTYIKGGYSVQLPELGDGKSIAVTANPVDEGFIKTTGLKIIQGVDLTRQDLKEVDNEDRTKRMYRFVLNEQAVCEFGWTPAEAVGKKMSLGQDRPGIVKAVVQDFHFASLHETIKPLILFPDTWFSTLLVKVSAEQLPKTIAFLESTWKELVPQRPFEFTFLDESFNKLYKSELTTGKVMNSFTLIAILLACLGLVGLSTYTIQQRTKEIGIRKVLGATVVNIVSLLSAEFLKWVGIAFIIAVPMAWYGANIWLKDFSYRIDISWTIFIFIGLLTLLITIAAVAVQAFRAARTNPVKNLRAE